MCWRGGWAFIPMCHDRTPIWWADVMRWANCRELQGLLEEYLSFKEAKERMRAIPEIRVWGAGVECEWYQEDTQEWGQGEEGPWGHSRIHWLFDVNVGVAAEPICWRLTPKMILLGGRSFSDQCPSGRSQGTSLIFPPCSNTVGNTIPWTGTQVLTQDTEMGIANV